MSTATDRQALWSRLAQAGVVNGAMPAASGDGGAWYVRAMIGIAAWIAALFLLVFVGIGLKDLVRTGLAAMITGVVVCAIVATMLRLARGTFAAQLGLALSLTGQGLFAWGMLGFVRHAGPLGAAQVFAVAAFEALLVLAVPHYVHRVFCALAAGFAASYALGMAGLGTLGLPLLAAGFVAVELSDALLARFPRALPPIGVGLALAIIAVVVAQAAADDFGLWRSRLQEPMLGRAFADAVMGAVFFCAAAWLVARTRVERHSPAHLGALAGALALAVVSYWVPGLSASLVILLAGFATSQRTLMGLGIVALLVALSRYYYVLSTTLLVKSAALLVTAAVLLLLWHALKRAGEGRDA